MRGIESDVRQLRLLLLHDPLIANRLVLVHVQVVNEHFAVCVKRPRCHGEIRGIGVGIKVEQKRAFFIRVNFLQYF